MKFNMKRYILLFAFLFSFLFGKTQQINLNNDTCFTEQEVIQIANKIYSLKQKDSLNIELINKYEKKINLMETRIKHDSILLSLHDRKLDIQKDRTEFYRKQSEKYKKNVKWAFLGGAGSIIISSLVLNWALN